MPYFPGDTREVFAEKIGENATLLEQVEETGSAGGVSSVSGADSDTAPDIIWRTCAYDSLDSHRGCKPLQQVSPQIGAFEADQICSSLYFRQLSQEVTIIRSMAPINLIVHYPKTAEGLEELVKRVSDVHAAAVTQCIKSLNCPTSQKLALLDAVIETVTERSKEQA